MVARSKDGRVKRRTRSPHPGVVLIPPNGTTRHATWRARHTDPDSGKRQWTKLDPNALRTAEARRDWAIRKARAIAKRKMDLEGGAAPATGTGLADAIDRYFEDHPQLRAGTRGLYRGAANKLLAWASAQRVGSADDLTGPRLVAFRAALVKEPKRAPTSGSARGAKEGTRERRAPSTVNVELRSVRTVLGYLRRLGLLPRLSADGLADSLKHLAVTSEAIQVLKPAQLQKLLAAALRHDAETYGETRAEHAGLAERGTTARYEAVAPYIATLLLTGMRRDEARTLAWAAVDLEALDNQGHRVGDIRLRGLGTKTHQARTIDLAVSPALRRLLAAMQLRSGGKGPVFPALTAGVVKSALRRLREDYGAPEFSPQVLRQTCGSYLTNAAGIFGAASAYHSARQLGHSVQVAERHYLDVVRGIPRDARTLEAAMQIESEIEKVIAAVGAARPGARRGLG